MTTAFFMGSAQTSFENFVAETPPEKLGESRGDHRLIDYIYEWVRSGEGIRVCAGDFQKYLLAIIAICDEWNRRPDLLRFVPENENEKDAPRQVSSVYGGHSDHHALDPHWFAQQVFDYCHPQQQHES